MKVVRQVEKFLVICRSQMCSFDIAVKPNNVEGRENHEQPAPECSHTN